MGLKTAQPTAFLQKCEQYVKIIAIIKIINNTMKKTVKHVGQRNKVKWPVNSNGEIVGFANFPFA